MLDDKKNEFISAMDDDLNTADAIASIFEMVRIANAKFVVGGDFFKKDLQIAKNKIEELCNVLGILKENNTSLEKEVEELIEERQRARKNKDWKRADEIRDILKSRGIVLEDTTNGVKWKKV